MKRVPQPSNNGANGNVEPTEAKAPLVADIPGLGPIRVRALEKAGFATVASLRLATLDQLLATPGISEAKARHIQYFLAQSPDPAATAPLPQEDAPMPARRIRQAAPSKPEPPDAASEPEAEPVAEAPTASERIAQLLAKPGVEMRPRLQRAIARAAGAIERYVKHRKRLRAKQRERAERRVSQALAMLAPIESGGALDRKKQARVADQLIKVADKLAAI